MSVQLTAEQQDLIQTIAQNENILEYSTTCQVGSIKGDNYLGIITSVKIESSDKSKVLNLILKSAQTSDELRKVAPVRNAYDREIYMYERVFPALKKFQKERGVTEEFSGVAKYYGSSNVDKSECIVLENLKERNYRLWERRTPMNSNHLEAVFREYARFHALSFAMKHLQPENYYDLTKDLNNIFEGLMSEETFRTHIELQCTRCYEVIGNNEIALNGLKKFSKEVEKLFLDLNDEQDYWVITHGDCWNNNMLFKYENPEEDTQKPTAVCLIDWQIARKCPPTTDLSYFFYTAASKEDLQDLDRYQSVYYETLSEDLMELGCDPETVYPLKVFKEHWKLYSKFGLYMAMMVMKVMLGESDEVPDLTETAKSGNDIMESMNFKIGKADTYKRRLCDLIEFMVERDFI